MSTTNDASNQHQPTEFELRRAEIVGQIGEVGFSHCLTLFRSHTLVFETHISMVQASEDMLALYIKAATENTQKAWKQHVHSASLNASDTEHLSERASY